MRTRTKAEKQEYSRKLRERWAQAKKLLTDEKISEIQAIIATHGMNVSNAGYLAVLLQMEEQGLDGIPYLDAKTYKGWKQNGFQVRRGEKSTLSGITWIGVGEPADGDEKKKEHFVFPKEYHLFHRSQVDAIGATSAESEAA